MYSYWNSSSLELENSRNHLHKGSERITSFLPLPILRNTLFFSFLPFYWNIIALQSYVSEFLLYSKVNQLYVRVCAYIYTYTYIYIYPLPLKPPSHAPSIIPLQVITEHRAESPVLYSSFPVAIYFTQGKCMYFNTTLSIHPTLSFPRYVHKFVLYVCISISALQISS